MSFNLELKNLTFMINSGISSFIQDDPNPIYNNKIINEKSNNYSNINSISDIQTLSELKEFIYIVDNTISRIITAPACTIYIL